MNNLEMLVMLKSNLEIATSVHDTYLGQLLEVGYKEIKIEGIKIDKVAAPEGADYSYSIEDIGDVNLIIMYAAYLYRKRADEGAPQMPRMLRYALNNRLFSQKIKEGGS